MKPSPRRCSSTVVVVFVAYQVFFLFVLETRIEALIHGDKESLAYQHDVFWTCMCCLMIAWPWAVWLLVCCCQKKRNSSVDTPLLLEKEEFPVATVVEV
jgi:hypothetical protein